jgi:pyruvate,orthophosphate dikinase
MKELLGGKGANLAEMTSIGLPVPPGFTITTEVCDEYYKSGRKLPKADEGRVKKNVVTLEKELGKKFGDDQPAAGSRSAPAPRSPCRA